MTYVPIVVTPTEELSPRARDLARTLEASIQEYRERNPTLSDAEIRQALAHLNRRRGPGAAVALVLGLAVAAILGVVLFMYVSQGSAAGTDQPIQWLAIGVGVIAAIAGVLLAMKRRGD